MSQPVAQIGPSPQTGKQFAQGFVPSEYDFGVRVNPGAVNVALRVIQRQAFPAIETDAYLDSKKELERPVSDIEW